MTKTITTLRIIPGYSVACFGADGRQITELNTSLLALFAEHAEALGYNPDQLICETSPVDRWRIIQRGGKWEVERA